MKNLLKEMSLEELKAEYARIEAHKTLDAEQKTQVLALIDWEIAGRPKAVSTEHTDHTEGRILI